ncbi:transmembrane protein 248 [Melanotaenia boesemani]|uniref:transmembrane protein 248 n=1 Tax=Melanotaenia boesemani TaxID=1250792 RepID=UPI001C055A8A|nr:transmembrane protein 248 [Melanotaenia boesemani]
MMGFWQPVSNLREYVSHNPPGATFFLCLLSLAISFICLNIYSSTHILPNPDVEKDWNHLFSSLSQFQLCVKENASSFAEVSSNSPLLMEQGKDQMTSVNSTKSSTSITVLHLRVPLTVTTSSPNGLLKDVGLFTTLKASQLYLEDKDHFNLTLEIVPGNSSHTCLSIRAATHLLPMNLLPPECPASGRNISTIHVEARNQQPSASQTCYSLHSKNDPELTVMLTPEEQSVAAQHVLEVSMCLLVVCLMLCLAASRPHSLTQHHPWKELDLQNEPLIDS